MRKQFVQIGRLVLATTLLLVMTVSAFTANASTVSAYLVAGEEEEIEFNITLNSAEISNEIGSSGGDIPNKPTSKPSVSLISLIAFLNGAITSESVADEYRFGSHKLSSTPPLYILFHSLKVDFFTTA